MIKPTLAVTPTFEDRSEEHAHDQKKNEQNSGIDTYHLLGRLFKAQPNENPISE